MIEKLSKFWSGAIAYVALLSGAGLSVAGNVADTFRVRGLSTDTLDIVLAAAWPLLVLLTIELFVSRRWSGQIGFQVLRWVGCLAIGSMAMMSSWVHLHDLLSVRGQIGFVATGGPLAIDGMAIMATGLLLSTRGKLATVTKLATAPAYNGAPYVATEADVAESEAAFRGEYSPVDEATGYLDRLATELDSTTTPAAPMDVHPVSGPPALARSNEVKPETVPDEIAFWIKAWEATDSPDRMKLKDLYEWLAGETGRSVRTIRRYRDALAKA
jgi:hypothetical protein